MKMLRSALALAGLVAVCLIPAACSTDGPTSSAGGARKSTAPAPTTTSSDTTTAPLPPCRDSNGTLGSGTRC